jgi:hypothetical protein
VNWLAFTLAVLCALIALAYALPALAVSALLSIVSRSLVRRTGIRLPLSVLGFVRLPWTPVALWGSAALIFGWIAISG